MMPEDEITVEARSEFDKDALWQAKDTVTEANKPERDKDSLTTDDAIKNDENYKKNLISEIASVGDKLDRIKHLIKRLDIHLIISNERARKSNILLLFLSIVMAMQAAIYIYTQISNNYGSMANSDVLSLNLDRLFFVVVEVSLLFVGYKTFVFGIRKMSEAQKRPAAHKFAILGTLLGLVTIILAIIFLFLSLINSGAMTGQSDSATTTIPAALDTTNSYPPLNKR